MNTNKADSFFPTPIQFVIPLFFATLVLGSLVAGGWSSGRFGAAVLFAVLLLSAWLFAVWRIRQPSLKVSGNNLQLRDQLGRSRLAFAAPDCELVLNRDWIGFRCSGQQEFDLDKAAFSNASWQAMRAALRGLPFREIKDVDCPSR